MPLTQIDTEGVFPIANTSRLDRRADIVFVHGLAGNSHGTWRHGKEGEPDHFFWPAELGKELPDCGIWTVGYAAGITGLGNPGMIIGQRAGNLATQLGNHGIGERPLIFITHSMGGLIVKSMVCDLPAGQSRKLIGNICGIVFCGTPHRGSDFARAAGILGRFLQIPGIQEHVRQMESNHVELDRLHDKFAAWHKDRTIPIDSYAENIGLFRKRWLCRAFPLGLVVPRQSANTGVGGAPHDVDADHLDLVKPASSRQPIYNIVYLGVLRFIREALDVTPPPPMNSDPSQVRVLILQTLHELGMLPAQTSTSLP